MGTRAAQVHMGSLSGILPELLFRDVREALHLPGFSVCVVNSDTLLKKKSLEIGGGNKSQKYTKVKQILHFIFNKNLDPRWIQHL